MKKDVLCEILTADVEGAASRKQAAKEQQIESEQYKGELQEAEKFSKEENQKNTARYIPGGVQPNMNSIQFKDGKIQVKTYEEQAGQESLSLSATDEKEAIKPKQILDNALTNLSLPEKLARQERYNLLSEKCTRERINHVLIAHHGEDQIETFFLRLSRLSGTDGTKKSFRK